MLTATAPGKAILFGEHAVVYGRPALAVPVTQVQATATLTPTAADGFWIEAPDLGRRYAIDVAEAGDPLAVAVALALADWRVGGQPLPPAILRVSSTIPIAAGLGSGAAVATAVVRVLAAWLHLDLDPGDVSALVFETEKLLHGTPSGIDNTVIAFGQPVYFMKGHAPEPIRAAHAFQLLIADTGRPSPTKVTVGDVRAAYEREPKRLNRLFDGIGEIAAAARGKIEAGQPEALGPLMTRNHALLRDLGVSSPELDRLVEQACAAGALGAKLSGGGRGGNMLALIDDVTAGPVRTALLAAGATRIIVTRVG
jgi:mevalonate kinase